MATHTLEAEIGAVRHFNRFFTRRIGVLREGLLHSPFALTEARILFELAHEDDLTATALCSALGLDPGYLSRILARFEGQGLIEKVRSERDGRQLLLRLTPAGKDAFAVLDQRSREEAGELLGELNPADRARLLRAMETIEEILDQGRRFKYAEPFVLRMHEPGDMGWVVHRHGVLYSQEYGWDGTFEGLVAEIVSDFVKNFNPARERCWIAEMDGEIVGSVFVVQKDEQVAKLRLLLVEPKARGLSLGGRLVDECVRFARRVGYKKMTLWTNSVLLSARHIYRKVGFTLVAEEAHHSYGCDLVGETWEMSL